MNPDNPYQPRPLTPLQPQGRSVVPPSRLASQQQATANIIRGQLENIYQGKGEENTPQTTPFATPQATPTSTPQPEIPQGANERPTRGEKPVHHGFRTAPPEPAAEQPAQGKTDQPALTPSENIVTSPYQRTMATSYNQQVAANQWQQYHEAWQKYYQLYYERHYLSRLRAQQKIEQEVAETIAEPPKSDKSVTPHQAMNELRQNIRQKVVDSTQKVKKSRHFMPIMAGVAVLLIVAFLQWNSIIIGNIAAYASPGSIQPQNIIPSPTTDIEVSADPRMIIPKINVDAPVVYGVGPDYNSQMSAMEKGIAHFSIPGASAVPGQVGNAVFAAHSSNDIFAPGDYGVVFAQNEKLVAGDIIYMNYESKRYTYSVTSTEVVLPTEVSKVQIQTDKPMLTLISCVPIGTAQKRLLVFAEQVSPDPAKAEAAASTDTSPTSTTIPGRPAPSLLERLFGAN